MENNTNKFETVVVIGNGFDLNLGFKTSYNDFIESDIFNTLIEADNKLCKHLLEQKKLHSWVDVECELKNYSNLYREKNRKPFKIEYENLCNVLCEYINFIDLTNYKADSKALSLTIDVLNKHNVLILDFNYTNSVYEILNKNTETIKCTIHNVHGLAKDRSIIFGIEESAHKNEDDIWLLKIVNKNYKKTDILSYLRNSSQVIFLGFSLGESDHSYFHGFFNDRVSYIQRTPPVVLFTFYGEDSRVDLHKQLFKISSRNLSGIIEQFNIEFKDIFSPQQRLLTQ